MDSLKVTGMTTSLGFVYWTDLLSGILMCIMFAVQIYYLYLKIENKGQSETLENMEGMVIKLIDRWNKSDERIDRKFDDLTKEINDLDNQVSEIKGVISRLNGKH